MYRFSLFFLIPLYCFASLALSWQHQHFQDSKIYEGSSDLVNLEYHMGPVLSYPINLYIIWYGNWNPNHQNTIKDFIHSLSSPAPFPSVSDWWRTIRLYTDQTNSNITGTLKLSGEFHDTHYSHGAYLSRLSMQSVIKQAAWPLNYQTGVYLVLTSGDVRVQDFCREVCGFHYFTFPVIVGVTVPYAWVGYSGTQCPGLCAYPFAWPKYSSRPSSNVIMRAPNGDPGLDGMISVIAHELAEVASNPLVNAWYAGEDPSAPTEIADMCVGVFGSGGGGGFVGQVYKDSMGGGYNVHGVERRKFLVQWVWDPVQRRCFGPNAVD